MVARPAVALSDAEADALAECEEVISKGFGTFVDVGRALLRIRDERLYRTTHRTFEDYCQATWSITSRSVRRMIDAAAVVEVLEDQSGPIGPVPANEAQARELAPLREEPEKLREVWRHANEATGGKPTAADVRTAREQLRTLPPPAPVLASTPDETSERPIGGASPPSPELLGGPTSRIANAEYVHNFLRSLRRGADWVTFDAERLAQMLDADELRILEMHAATAERFVEQVRRARRGLKVINGGAK